MLILQGPNHPIDALTFSPDSTTLFAVQGFHGIRAWNVADRTATRAECEGRLLVAHYVCHPSGRWAFSRTAHTRPPNNNGALAIDLATGTARPFDCDGPRDSVAFRPDGGVITVGLSRYETTGLPESGHYISRLCGWTVTAAGPQLAWQREMPTGENLLFVSALGDRLATAEALGSLYTHGERVDRVTIRRGSDGEPEVHLPFPHAPLQQLLAPPDGTVLAARHGAELHAWDATDWNRPATVVRGHWSATSQAGAGCFHPSGRHMLLVNDTPAVQVFDTTTWKRVQLWKWSAGTLRAVVVSPDGTLAAAGGANGAVVVWDLDL